MTGPHAHRAAYGLPGSRSAGSRAVSRQARDSRGVVASGLSAGIDMRALETGLRSAVEGEVRFDSGSRALYATDASNYRQPPIGVVVPRDKEDVVRAVAVCRQFGVPVLPRGGGTSLAGQCCNVAVVLDMSKYMRGMLELDPLRRLARVQPGIVLDVLRERAEQHHLTFGPDPATHNRSTLGGMIGNNSCGVHSIMAGKTEDNVEELEVLTYDGLRLTVGRTSDDALERRIAEGGRIGDIYAGLKALRDRYSSLIRSRFPAIPRRVSGYNLPQLLPEYGFNVARALVGTEGTCVTVLEATVNLIVSPAVRVLVVLGYSDVYTAADNVPAIMSYHPIGLEGFDDRLVQDLTRKRMHLDRLQFLPKGGGWLLVEFGGESREEAADNARRLMSGLAGHASVPDMRLVVDPGEQKQMWEVRESGLGATAKTPGGPFTWEGWEDSAVPPERFGAYLRDLRKLLNRYHYSGAFYGHFGHGCLHTRVDCDLTSTEGIAAFRSFCEHAADLVVSYGGSLSGEHGDGQARAELLPRMFGEELVAAFREFKSIWDPQGRMNPGKVVDPFRLDENLRLGVNYNPPAVKTHFAFPEDGGSLADATLRCVGVGKCRRMNGGLMCPSYMVTLEEADSTRGRAHLLWEMLQGDITPRTWRNEHVKEALDLCLACKGCKSECPVNVDMASYKAEFLSHYYAGRARPPAAYSMGLIYWWARLAARMPSLVNILARAPILSSLAKRVAGIAPQRTLPTFAPRTFRAWFRARDPRNLGAPDVLLWTDTFNNHFHPDTARAAVEVLEAAGLHVLIPDAAHTGQTLCCGRPLYDFGMLDLARSQLKRILSTLRQQIRAGIPVIVLEPSCYSVFRDELLNLLPHDEDAHRLAKQTHTLGDFLAFHAPSFEAPSLARTALLQPHCHDQSLTGLKGERAIMRRMGLDVELPDAGCCGMAGAFGFEREHYEVSVQCGERVLLPAVRAAAADTLIVADGFSCREQIAQSTDRRALHLAEVLRLALHDGASGDAGEQAAVRPGAGKVSASRLRAGVVVAGLVGVAAAAMVLASRRRRT